MSSGRLNSYDSAGTLTVTQPQLMYQQPPPAIVPFRREIAPRAIYSNEQYSYTDVCEVEDKYDLFAMGHRYCRMLMPMGYHLGNGINAVGTIISEKIWGPSVRTRAIEYDNYSSPYIDDYYPRRSSKMYNTFVKPIDDYVAGPIGRGLADVVTASGDAVLGVNKSVPDQRMIMDGAPIYNRANYISQPSMIRYSAPAPAMLTTSARAPAPILLSPNASAQWYENSYQTSIESPATQADVTYSPQTGPQYMPQTSPQFRQGDHEVIPFASQQSVQTLLPNSAPTTQKALEEPVGKY